MCGTREVDVVREQYSDVGEAVEIYCFGCRQNSLAPLNWQINSDYLFFGDYKTPAPPASGPVKVERRIPSGLVNSQP